MRTIRASLLVAALTLSALALAPAASAVTINAGIGNLPPVIVSISLSGLTSGALSPTAGTTSTITATVVASDPNGATDITGVTVGIIKPDGSTVHLAEAAGTAAGTSGLQATFTKTLAMNYYDAAALTSSKYSVKATATDSGTPALTGTNLLSLAVFNYNQLVALNAPSSISLSATPGQAGSASGLSVNNYGNVQIDTQVSGTDLTFSSSTISVGDVAYSLNSDMTSSSALTGSAVTLSSYNLAPASGASKSVYFQLTPTIPAGGLPVGTYTGTLTVAAVSG
jgi:hypothetical protein